MSFIYLLKFLRNVYSIQNPRSYLDYDMVLLKKISDSGRANEIGKRKFVFKGR